MSAVVDAEPTPSEIVHTVLADQNADPSVRISRNRISEPQIEPILTDGYSGNRLYRARVAWNGGAIGDGGSATWLLKRWQPGGHGECLLGVDRPLEALAWEQGVLRREAMPPGVVTPIIGARLDPSGDAAWIVMEDVSADLGAYSRESPLPPTEAVARVKQVLDGLARLHAWWESPHRQARLRQCAGLVPLERFVWCQAASYAAALDRTPPSGTAAGSPVTDEFRADVQAFLAWLPASDRAVLETVLYRREPLIEALSTFPQTLLHGDADDRNIGLRYRADPVAPSGKSGHSPDLVLIDWEWISVGPPALDVARVCGSAAAVCSPYEPRPEALFSGELSDYYFECYRAHGGTLADRDMWRRSFGLAFLAAALTQVPFAGSMIRHGVTPVVETFERQIEMLMPAARSLATT
jgi:hypothetical protein